MSLNGTVQAASANTVTTTAIPATTYCVGASGTAVSVPFTSTGTYTGNTYTAYIGSTSIGTLVSDLNSGTISATIPASLASGNSYRIRVDASSPATTGSDNGANLTVVNYQTNNVTAFAATAGNAQVPLTWTNPTVCLTRTVVVASAATITAVPSGTFTADAAFGNGTDLGSGQFVVYDGPGTGVTVTALTNGTPYFFKAFTTYGDGYSTGATATATPVAPVATLTASTSPATTPTSVSLASTSQGTPSVAKTYTLTGANLGTADVTVTAPTGFQVSTTSAFTGITLDANSLTLTPSSGSLNQTVYVRLSGQVAGALSGTVVNTNGTLTANVLVSGTVTATAAEPTVQPTVAVSNVGFSQVDVTLAGGNGQKRLLVVRANSATNSLPVDNNTYVASTVRGSGSQIGTGNFVVVADGSTTTLTLTGLSSSSTYVLSVYAYNDDAVAGQENYLTNAPGTVSFSTPAVPATFYSKATGDLNLTSTFGSNPDGSGASPSNFTGTGKTYSVSGTHTISANWVVSGTGSKVVLATGSNFTLPAGFNLTGNLDMLGTAYLTVLNTSPSITYGSLDATSTVEFAQASGTYTVPGLSGAGGGYGNLKLKNSIKRFATNQTDIYGNLIIEDVATVGGTSTSTFSTVALDGNLTLLGATTFDPTAARRITLACYGATPQTFTGNGITLRLFSLKTQVSGGGVVLADGNGGTPVEVGNASGGGVDLTDGSTLALNGNTLSFTPGSRASISNTGTFTLSPTSSLNLESVATSGTIGSLFITPGTGQLNNLRLSHRAGDFLDVSESLTINGVLVLDTNGALEIGPNQSLTLNGTVAGTGTILGASTSDLIVGGSGALGTLRLGAGASGVLRNLTLNRTTGTLTLGSPLTVNGAFSLTNGIISTSAANLLTLGSAAALSGGSATSFVNGLLARITTGPATTVFPIGKDAAYRPLTLNATAQTSTTTYTASLTNSTARTNGVDAPLTRVSNIRYATLTPNAQPTGFSGTLTMAFDVDDYVTDPQDPTLVMAKRNGSTNWVSIGRTTATGNAASGNVAGDLTSDVFTSFSDFALASTAAAVDNSLGSNPLPVELTAFSAQRQPDKAVSLKWNTASEKNSARFDVQRSLDGREYLQVASVAAQGASTQATAYAALDKNAPAGRLYYRLRQVDLDGSIAYSPVVTVASSGEAIKVELYPNPAHSRISFIAAAATPYRVLSQLGQPLLRGTTEAGTASIGIETLPTGLYFLELQTAAGRTVHKFEKQ